MDDGSSRPLDINPAAISAITSEFEMGAKRIGATVHIHGTCFSVIETRAEILALLAAPPVAVTADSIFRTARDHLVRRGFHVGPEVELALRAGIEAALAARPAP